MLQPRVHSFSVGTVHTVRDFFFGLSVFSLEVPGDMDCSGNNVKIQLGGHKVHLSLTNSE